MSNFAQFKTAVDAQLRLMEKTQLFVVEIDKDEFYQLYLNSFTKGTIQFSLSKEE